MAKAGRFSSLGFGRAGRMGCRLGLGWPGLLRGSLSRFFFIKRFLYLFFLFVFKTISNSFYIVK
jgi:hypothetical protein